MTVFCRILFLLWIVTLPALANDEPVRIGSKSFTESYVLGEIAREALERKDMSARHMQGMGGTIILWQALTGGAIDLYPDYTGTIAREILKSPRTLTLKELRRRLSSYGIGITSPLGFNNTYTLVLSPQAARKTGAGKISDLRHFPYLRAGFTHEFMERDDGWRPLQDHYELGFEEVRSMEHNIGYLALESGQIDVKEAYSTDARIAALDLVPLTDDLHYFPRYDAVFLYRLDLPEKARLILNSLEGTLDEKAMRQLNALAERENSYEAAATAYFGEKITGPERFSWLLRILHWTGEHIFLVLVSMVMAVMTGLPLGIAASRPGMTSHIILGMTGILYTIPSLALLALLVPVPWLGVSTRTAVAALFIYSLLPIVRNTASGLQSISLPVRESAEALGIEPLARLMRIYLPLTAPTILAGIKTSTVINIGTATLAALIGAGGLGEPILSGLNLNDHRILFMGALPAAGLAVAAQALFSLVDRILVSPGLRLDRQLH